MNGLTLLLGATAVFLVGYAVYSKFLSRVLGIDPSRPTPAHTRQDGCDYVPAHPTVLFGHHFAAIAGAAAIVTAGLPAYRTMTDTPPKYSSFRPSAVFLTR